MKLYDKLRKKLTLAKVTKFYLWWVVIRWFLRWGATVAFLAWIWCLAPEDKKNDFKQKMRFKVSKPNVEWYEVHLCNSNNVKKVEFGLREDGVLIWK